MNGTDPGQNTSSSVNSSSEDHICTYPQVEILTAEEDDELKVGMQVLIPCPVCGDTPLDHLEWSENRQQELQDALLAVQPYRPLYHWAPFARRKQIIRYGLRPMMRPTTNIAEDYKTPYVCFAVEGQWDLWMTWLDEIPEPMVHATPDRPSGLYEVRTIHRIYKSKLWYVGSRFK
jgi:hypothetical protein